MLQWLLRGLVVAVFRRLFVVGAAPFVLLIATPIIFVGHRFSPAGSSKDSSLPSWMGMPPSGMAWSLLSCGRFTVTWIDLRLLDVDHLTNRWS